MVALGPRLRGDERESSLSAPRPITVITGASAGIGAALARVFARHGHELALVARRADRLAALANEIAATGARKPLVIAVDLQHPGAAGDIAKALAAANVEPQFMVNNAGFGLIGLAGSHEHERELAMIDVNVRVLTELSLAFVDSLARHRGGLLNVGSLAGFLPGPGMAVYYATKGYVLSLTHALHSELKARGVRVTALCPGPVATEFAEVAGLAGWRPSRWLSQTPEQVAQAGYRGLMRGKSTVVPGLGNKLLAVLVPLTPRRLVLVLVNLRQTRRRALKAS
jgi:hypothetical protein